MSTTDSREAHTPPRLRLAWLVGLTVVVATIVAWFAQVTRERVAENEAQQIISALNSLLPAGSFDNEPHHDRIFVSDAQLPGNAQPVSVYRARRGATPTAAVLAVVAPQGYVGPITLLVALAPGGTVLGVRVVEHRETPGLGDGIDVDRGNWPAIFTGHSLTDPPPARWATRRDGGDFDQITGATTTSRAVVTAVRDTAAYFGEHEAEIFARPAQ